MLCFVCNMICAVEIIVGVDVFLSFAWDAPKKKLFFLSKLLTFT